MDLDKLKVVRRGYVQEDEKFFKGSNLESLKKASKDVGFLINRDYDIKSATTFVGNHYLLSERQRLFLSRALSKKSDIEVRQSKELSLEDLNGRSLVIDGFNTIITLETALSSSLIFKGADGTIRDLAGLRGTYKIIDKTVISIKLILDTLTFLNVKKAEFYLDKPVSNSGRLKELIMSIAELYKVIVEVYVINNVDSVLECKGNVVTTDAIILNKCISWVNLNNYIINENIKDGFYIDMSNYND